MHVVFDKIICILHQDCIYLIINTVIFKMLLQFQITVLEVYLISSIPKGKTDKIQKLN